MNLLAKWVRIELKSIGLELSADMAYKTNFFIKCLAVWTYDFVGPIVALLIYSTTLGIPGWGLYEFLLFQGTVTLVFGFGNTFAWSMTYKVIESIRDGEFDKYLVKPLNTLFYLFTESINSEGFAEIFAGCAIVVFAMAKLGLSLFSLDFLLYLVLVLAGFAFEMAISILVSSAAFLVVKSEALMNLYFKISDFARYPLNVYSGGVRFFLTFIIPLGVSSFYPATILLKGATSVLLLSTILPVFVFCAVSILLWNHAMKKYSSAGG